MKFRFEMDLIGKVAPEPPSRYRLCAFTKNRSDAQRLTCRECLDRICKRLVEIGLDDERQPLPWTDRPECGARNRSGQQCRLKVVPGKKRCRLHGGLSTGPKTQSGKAKIAEAQRKRWAKARHQSDKATGDAFHHPTSRSPERTKP